MSSVFEVAKKNFIRFFQNAYSFPSNIQVCKAHWSDITNMHQANLLLLNDTYHFDQYVPYTLASVQQYQQTDDASKLERFYVNDIKPQSVNAFELGYAALVGKKF